ncbi:vascular endothelial growth factor receptor 3-like [Copidosoma floridanum]|uniref:vascular endothelial growth factor receptor 3-like n=1 Tax=Copidosoma floridanum TaxID=29053 RepID=UPI000C6F710E|nr:vascular endothelial growth factor receptor 3-like [Copidosoma floridanum]
MCNIFKFKEMQLLEAGLAHFEEGALDLLIPEQTVDDQAELLPYNRRWEFSREKLKLKLVELLELCELLIIVELCRFRNLESYLECHRENFINQIDLNTDKINPRIGKNMRRSKYKAFVISDYINTASGNNKTNNEPIIYITTLRLTALTVNLVMISTMMASSQDLLLWAYQVANGMEYLSQRRVLHCDLAARNILLAEYNFVKICDFGLAKALYKDENYKKQHEGQFPVKWMAIESMRDGVFSTMSDVWSFGVVL